VQKIISGKHFIAIPLPPIMGLKSPFHAELGRVSERLENRREAATLLFDDDRVSFLLTSS